MTALQLERQEREECIQCGEPAACDSDYCEKHRDDARARTKACMAALRELRRELGLCVDCGEPSRTYRCAVCRPPANVHTLDLGPAA